MNPRWLAALKMLTSTWPGKVEGGPVDITNPLGRRPPLVWVFNAETEFLALSEALGPDQPVIGLRSLNLIVPYDEMRLRDQDALGRSYGEILSPILRGRPCFIGGNCQAAHISTAIAAYLLAHGRTVLGFLSIDAEHLLPLPLPYCPMFGEFSRGFNPSLKGISHFPIWHRAFREVRPRILPAGHGEYFVPPSLPVLARHIASFTDHYQHRSARLPTGCGLDLDTSTLPSQMRPGETVFVALAGGAPPAFKDMLARWHDHQNPGLTMSAHPVRPGPAGPGFDLVAPDAPGSWELQLFRCQHGAGPVFWPSDIGWSRLISVVPAVCKALVASQ